MPCFGLRVCGVNLVDEPTAPLTSSLGGRRRIAGFLRPQSVAAEICWVCVKSILLPFSPLLFGEWGGNPFYLSLPNGPLQTGFCCRLLSGDINVKRSNGFKPFNIYQDCRFETLTARISKKDPITSKNITAVVK